MSFKRDLKSLGLTETQIHDLIPDDGAGKSPPKVVKAPKEEPTAKEVVAPKAIPGEIVPK